MKKEEDTEEDAKVILKADRKAREEEEVRAIFLEANFRAKPMPRSCLSDL